MNPGAYGAPTIESTLEPEAQIGRLPAPKPSSSELPPATAIARQQFERAG